MQARRRCPTGTRASSAAEKSVRSHQHGPLYTSAVQSWQAFGPPQSGQRATSHALSAGESVDWTGTAARQRWRRTTTSAPIPIPTNAQVDGSGTATALKPSISTLPVSTSTRTKLMLSSATAFPLPSRAQAMS